jgi:Condensation domain
MRLISWISQDLASENKTAELPPITAAERSERLALSFAQQRLWFLAQMEGGSEAYHIPFGLSLEGKLDRVALRRTLDRIVERQEALRTTFEVVDGEPGQRIAAARESGFELLEHDLRQSKGQQAELDHLRREEARKPFDMAAGRLIRGRLIQLGEAEHVLLVTMHHIVSDGWSMGVFFEEFEALYNAFEQGAGDPLQSLALQYADYAAWQRKWLEGERLQQQAEYWRQRLAGAPAVLELPADHARPAQQEYAGAFVEVVLDEQLTAGLKELSRRHGATLYMTMLAGWTVLLARLSGQTDVVTGTPVANRDRGAHRVFCEQRGVAVGRFGIAEGARSTRASKSTSSGRGTAPGHSV